ncbi:MAG TPA: hypothetical protein VFG68_10495 [Fimbriiglobus sp.]|nr:hypothetical protein [Fimbriiglobus sp.]
MSRYLTKWTVAAVVGAAGWVASAGPASAQYMPAFGGGFRTMGSPFFGSPYNMSPFMSSPYMMMGSYGYSFRNPVTGGMFNYQYSPYGGYSGYSFVNPFTGQATSYQAYMPYMMSYGYGGGGRYGGSAAPYGAAGYSGATSGGYGYSSNPIANQQLQQLRAASYRNSYPSGGYGDGRSYMSPRWTTAATEKKAGKPADVNEALLKASEKDIHSGRALNALATEIRKLEGKGAKAEAPLFPAEVLAQAAFEGTAKETSGKPASELAPKWGPTGATVAVVVRTLDRNKIQFAPAPAGAAEAYGALYRGFTGYYVALAAAKK